MSAYRGNSRERIVQLGTAAVAAAPVRGTLSHLVVSPRSSRGLPTQGFAWTLIAPSAGSAIATAPGFTVQIYRSAPTLGVWLAMQQFTAANYNDQLVFPDISGGMAIYVQITNVATPGNVLFCLAELD